VAWIDQFTLVFTGQLEQLVKLKLKDYQDKDLKCLKSLREMERCY